MELFSEIYKYVTILFVIFCLVQFFDTIFKTCMFYPYLIMMNNFGITIKPYMVAWEITMLNNFFKKMGRVMPSLQRRWFDMGFYLSFISIFVAFGLLIMPIIGYFAEKLSTYDQKELVVSVIPGVTTPFSHLAYIIPALIISVVYHELGHALAASRENVPVESCGLTLVLIFPVAFVYMDQRKLSICSSIQKLRVYCAGVWHNLVLLILSLLFVNYAQFILYPYFQTNIGVTALHIGKESNLAHAGGFTKGDVITSINNCEVTDARTWFNCLAEISASPQIGFCSPKQYIQNYGNISHCCTHSDSNDHLCFKLFMSNVDNFACLPARKVIDDGAFCRNNSDCSEKLCALPFLLLKDEKLIKIQRSYQKSVLYIGSVNELYFSIKISSWVSDVEFPSIELVTHMENFFKYLLGISAGLIIMNVIPCYYLDGGYIIEHLINYLDRSLKLSLCLKTKTYFVKKFKMIGLMLLVGNILIGLKNVKVLNM